MQTSAIICPVVESISGARQTCVKGKGASALSNKLCTVQVLEGLKNLSALWNSGVSTFQEL